VRSVCRVKQCITGSINLLKDAPKLLMNTDQAVLSRLCEVRIWLRQQPKDFYAAGIGTLIKRWDKCINVNRDYVEK
jgi:hypothetical protein